MLSFAVIFVIGVLAQQTFADEPEAIVGGTPAAPAEFPWQVSLQRYGSHFCGGSIIAPNKILTAAHCIHGLVKAPYSDIRVVSATNYLGQGESHIIKSVRVHPSYNDQTITNDVAVITLAAPIRYNDKQRPISLADSAPVPGTLCTLSGWGLTRTNGSPSQTLLKMNQAIVGQSECQQSLRGVGATITAGNVCALNKRGIGACQGDSGGPFVCNGKQYGITSWGIPCGQGVPDAYTNVYHYRSFIEQS